MTAEIIHDHDITTLKRWHEKFLDIELKAWAVDRSIDYAGSVYSVAAQSSHEGHCIALTKRCFGAQTLTALAPASYGRHIGFSPSLINEYKAFEANPALICPPLLPTSSDFWSILLARH